MCSPSCVLVFVMPIGLQNIGWKMYMVNGGWDVIVIVLIVSNTFHSMDTYALGTSNMQC